MAGVRKLCGYGSLLLSVVVCASGCNDDTRTSEGSPPASGTSLITPSTRLQPPASFCDLATRATKGDVALRDPVESAALTQAPGLTSSQRSRMQSAIEDAAAQLATGAGYSNDLLVAVVNDICGLKLTPVTMVE